MQWEDGLQVAEIRGWETNGDYYSNIGKHLKEIGLRWGNGDE